MCLLRTRNVGSAPRPCLSVLQSSAATSADLIPASHADLLLAPVIGRALLSRPYSEYSSSALLFFPATTIPKFYRNVWNTLGCFISPIQHRRLYSSVVERQSCKLKVLGSIPSGGSLFRHSSDELKIVLYSGACGNRRNTLNNGGLRDGRRVQVFTV